MSKLTFKDHNQSPSAPGNAGEYSVYLKQGKLYKQDHLGNEEAIGVAGLSIPSLQVLFRREKDKAAGTGFSEIMRLLWAAGDTAFLDLNPEVWLFRNKQIRRKKGNLLWVKKGFRHPTDPANYDGLSGLNQNNGQSFVKDSDALTQTEIIDRKSEWPLPLSSNGVPFDIDLQPEKWFFYKDANDLPMPYWKPCPGNLNLADPNVVGVKAAGMATKGYNQVSVQMAFAIAVENPNWTPTNKQPKKIIGPLSKPFVLKIQEGKFVYASGREGVSYARLKVWLAANP